MVSLHQWERVIFYAQVDVGSFALLRRLQRALGATGDGRWATGDGERAQRNNGERNNRTTEQRNYVLTRRRGDAENAERPSGHPEERSDERIAVPIAIWFVVSLVMGDSKADAAVFGA
jgi:hypothetical protein